MIWLATADVSPAQNFYFEIRDVALNYAGHAPFGIVRGIVGDGCRELWSEVELGHREQARILPVLSETGEIESFDGDIDEDLLAEQILEEVKARFLRSAPQQRCGISLDAVRETGAQWRTSQREAA